MIHSVFTSALHSKIQKSKESYLREFENRASLSATASSDSRITSTNISATLVQVLPGVGQHYCVVTDSL